ncbi:MAG: ATP-binding protein [bacterium]|nr:ATP-binding protein [bacterium]
MSNLAAPRLALAATRARLAVMPAVVVAGARQTGKSTLARELLADGRRYVTLDDLDVRDAAHNDPEVLVGGTGPVTIDEIQRAPDLLHAIKRAIDRDRVPGRFLLTGSANLLLMHRVSETLAGRASYLTLWPMTRREQAGLGACGPWEQLLEVPDDEWPSLLASAGGSAEPWQEAARRGGFPTPALHLRSDAERAIWHDGYASTYLERDLRDLGSVASLPDFRRLMRAAALRLGQLVNQSELARDCGLAQATAHRWLNLLEASFMLVRVPSYAVNRTKRLVKAPKLYWGDTALALHVSGGEPKGAHLENLVLLDLLAWRDSRLAAAEICGWRTTSGEEVDFVIESGDRLLPIEVKATTRPSLADARHLRAFRAEYGDRSRAGLLLHAGTDIFWLTPDVLAAPWWVLV